MTSAPWNVVVSVIFFPIWVYFTIHPTTAQTTPYHREKSGRCLGYEGATPVQLRHTLA